MVDQDDEGTDRFSRLAQATEGLRPTPGFNRRVMAAIEAEPNMAWASIARTGRWVLAAAALTATVAIGVAVQGEHALDDELAGAYGMVELDW